MSVKRLNSIKSGINVLLSKPGIRRRYEAAQVGLANVSGSSRAASHIFHTVAPIRFNREQFSVVAGQKAYYEKLRASQASAPALRRNTHRLEKGLLMRPRRPVFALDYIGETLEYFEIALQNLANNPGSIDIDELRWANDVLAVYFESTDGQVEVANHRDTFTRLTRDLPEVLDDDSGPTALSRTPYLRGTSASPVDYESLLALSERRRSVRWFEQKPVERELIDKAMMVARQAPTACNRMPYEFLVFDQPDLVQEIAGIPFGTGGYAENIPVIVVLVGQLDNYFSPRDRHAIYVDTSLAAMSFMFGLETLGLGSCAINWPDFEPLERKMAKTLGLSSHERPIMLMAVGYPDPEGEIAFSQKKRLDSFRFYNRTQESRSA